MRLAAVEYERVGELFDALSPDQWATATNCPPWDVRQMACHMLGMAEMAASILEQRRQVSAATRRGGIHIDALTAVQVDKHGDRGPDEIRSLWAHSAPRAARGRRRIPPFIRRRTMPQTQMMNGIEESWTIGYLTETILTRDPWMHRLDIAAVTDIGPTLTADHDGVIVDDVVHEWAARHGQPATLRLTGPAGGSWAFGDGGAVMELDAVDFCWRISGRAPADGLTATQVPF
jgi:uncharacterized protein (TIGR03083 family)